MPKRDPAFDQYVLKIYAVLNKLDYYRLLGVNNAARVPEIKKAFFAIAAKFHPDRNRDADAKVQKAIYDIFKRLNEAYRILCDYEKRTVYNDGLAKGKIRLEQDNRRTSKPKTPEETILSKDARQFYVQAKESLKAGNLMQAELHIKIAQSREKDNAAINLLFSKIEAAKAAKKK